MGSTLRVDASNARILERLAVAWDKWPHRDTLPLGALIARAVRERDPGAMSLSALETVTTIDLVEAVERYVLLADAPTKLGVHR